MKTHRIMAGAGRRTAGFALETARRSNAVEGAFPVHRRGRLGTPRRTGQSVLLALGTIALESLLSGTAARAQSCNPNPNPSAPAPITYDVPAGNYNSDSTPAFLTINYGVAGCNGQASTPGQQGLPGQPGAGIASTSNSVSLTGSFLVVNPLLDKTMTFQVGGYLLTQGGIGGIGGVGVNTGDGGLGGNGGVAGSINVAFAGSLQPSAQSPSSDFGLWLVSLGGSGGAGGAESGRDASPKVGGTAGNAAPGGPVTLTAGGSIEGSPVAVFAESVGGNGGRGGYGDTSQEEGAASVSGNGGNGGNGGKVSIAWTQGQITAAPYTRNNPNALSALSLGGDAGNGENAGPTGNSGNGGNGGNGGDGGSASVLMSGGSLKVTSGGADIPVTAGIVVQSLGGSGGIGGKPGGTNQIGGNGGAGGAGGNASATVLATIDVASPPSDIFAGQGVLVQSSGGSGGDGANAVGRGAAGGGGFAGAGGSASVIIGNAANQGTISVAGGFVQGAVVQSIGGGGGKAGAVSWGAWSADAGAGADGGAATLTAPNALVTVSGTNGTAAIVQSLGGGGIGGDVVTYGVGAAVAIGGNGGNGGQGGPVNITLGSGSFQQIGTAGGGGILAQSVGGAGGAAGDAYAYAAGFYSLAIGGRGGAGGTAGPVTVSNGALIGTLGDHAAGVTAQSIGGGGGKGGAGFAIDGGVVVSAAVALGGSGGTGGTGGAVTLTGNTGQIITYGSDAPAVVLQSIGGGGGAGGGAAARSVSVSPDPRVPAISVSFAAGGSGGSGNAAGPVGLTNSGLITTAGDGSMGVIAQSVGGGGGIGGDSTASSYSGGSGASSAKISVSVAMGGQGGTGGTGGNVTLANSGVLATFGQDAYGVFAQSVGGGGGIAGAGDASSSADKAKGSVAASIGLGGTGGVGGAAGQVTLTNSGAITTSGDGSDAVFAQTVGGGGGAGGGGVTTAAGGTLSSSVAVGGRGGGGNDGNTTTAQNSGLIITRGTDAIGLSVQSVGGGGGKGGKAGATAGGTTEIGSAGALFNILSTGLGLSQTFIDLGNGFVRIGRDGERIVATANQLANILSQPQAGAKEVGTAVQLNVAVGVGGGGGGGGDGGVVSATNTGVISTFGAQSDGIYAQSVGGGGGSAGSATSTAAAAKDTPVQTAISVGGTGGSGGLGGPVTVVNGPGGAILTQGVAAVGIFAQSVGGGGGEGAAAGSVSGSFKSLSASLGGDGGQGGQGDPVSVTTGDGGSTITTTGKHGIGILAQSVGGGGGVVRTMTTDMTFDPAKLIENPQGRIGDYHGLTLTFGGRNGTAGSGGPVQVTTSGAITTAGLGAHAILAQSVGGGGGLALGGQAIATYVGSSPPKRVGDTGGSGDGGDVTVNLKPGTVIQTGGDGAYGVLAQSVGGGGGVFGDLSQSNSCFLICVGTNFLESIIAANVGNGGNVSVMASGAQVRTSGANATSIFAQSVGGGGGLGAINVTSEIDFVDVRSGTVNGGGAGGSVGVSLVSSSVVASGANSTGILAQSAGSAPGSATISIDANSVVEATTQAYPSGVSGAAILILDGTANRINNAGVVAARGPDGQYSSGIAIQTNTADAQTTIVNTGQIHGNFDLHNQLINLLGNRADLLDNRVGGVLNAPTALQLGGGLLRNAGTLHVGGIGLIGRTVLTGDLVQGATGILRIDTNAFTGKADLLEIRGKAELAGTIRVDAVGLRKGETDPIVTASGGLTLRTVVTGAALPVFTQTAVLRGNTLTLATDAEFGAGDPSKSRNQRGLTGALQRIWDGGLPGFEQGFAGLARLPDERAYRQALDSLSGEVHASATTTQAQTAFFVQEAILDRLRFGGGEGAAGVPQLGLTGSIGTRFAPGTTLPSAYSANLPGGPAVSEVPVRPAASGYAVWGQAFGAFGETASNGNAGRLTRQISGFVLGAETGAGVLAAWRVGLAAGYSLTTFDVSARQSYGNVESGFGAVYARGTYGPLQFRLGVAYTGSALDTRRTVSVPGLSGTATGRSGGDTVQGFGEVGHRFDFGQGYLEPFVGAAALRIRRDGFTEQGGPAALTVFGRSYEIGTATAGLQGQAALAPLLGIDLPIVARGLIGYRRAFGDVEPRALLAFSGGTQTFPTAGAPIARDALVASAGLDLVLASGVTVGVNYTGQAGDRARDHAVEGLLSYRW